jgi:polyisoprenoid-binding protein YceI
MTMIRILVAVIFMSMATSAMADWTLNNDESRLNFVSVKAGDVAEVHRFRSLSGAVDQSGNALVEIDLTTVDTMIEVRDGRMREVLFETETFPVAQLTTNIDMTSLSELEPGDIMLLPVEGKLALHGQTLDLTIELLVSRLAADRLLVSSAKPVIVNAAQVDLAAGIEQLREIAGLPSISLAVPVTFSLLFEN